MFVRRCIPFCIAAVVLAATESHAFNGSRQGFMLGFGAGFGRAEESLDSTIQGLDVGVSESWAAFVSDFKIGGGINDQWWLYWQSRVSWFSADVSGGFGPTHDVTFIHGHGGVGATYFFNPLPPSVFVSALVGFVNETAPFEDGAETNSGPSLQGGVGFEFAPHWAVEGTLGWGSPDIDVSGADFSTFNILVSLNGTLY